MYIAGFELHDRGDILEATQEAGQENKGEDKVIRQVGVGNLKSVLGRIKVTAGVEVNYPTSYHPSINYISLESKA